MAIEPKALTNLNQEYVLQNITEAVSRINEDNSTLDLRQGVLFSLLVYYHAMLATRTQEMLETYLNARSLNEIEKNPELADQDIVDAVLSNFLVTRKPGNRATGEVTVVVATDNPVVIGVGSVFEANGERFVTQETFSASTADELVGTTGERVLTPTQDGNWAFTVTVIAENDGVASNIKKDSLVVPSVRPNGYVTSYASFDFSGGISAENNTELLLRLQTGVAAKAVSNRVNITAMLRSVDAFSRIVTLSIIGYGDVEMLRDKHSIFPVSYGGRCDLYIRTQEDVMQKAIVKEGVLVTNNNDGTGIWQITLDKNDAPGFYYVSSVKPEGVTSLYGSFSIIEDNRGIDIDVSQDPDVIDSIEGAYTRYQTAVIRFHDTLTRTDALAIGAKKSYSVDVVYLPLLAEMQDYLQQRSVKGFGSDCLVRAPIPCFVRLHFAIHKQSGTPDPDVSAIKSSIRSVVSHIGFTGRVYASQVYDAIYGHLQSNMHVSAIDMLGVLMCPNGEKKFIRGADTLSVEEINSPMVSSRTIQFFVLPQDIDIVIKTNVPFAS